LSADIGHELGHGVDRQARIDGQEIRMGCDGADRREILRGIVRGLAMAGAIAICAGDAISSV